jgi:hypothetical protein
VIVAKDVERSMYREAHQLFVQRAGPAGDTRDETPGRGRANVDVSKDGAVGLWQRKRQDVGQAATAGRPTIQTPHGDRTDERQVDARVPRPFPPEHTRRDSRQGVSRRRRGAPAARPS